jgi:hypothetical protein
MTKGKRRSCREVRFGQIGLDKGGALGWINVQLGVDVRGKARWMQRIEKGGGTNHEVEIQVDEIHKL